MKCFLKELCCNGLQPSGIPMGGLLERNALVSRLMLEQDKAMVLCAPVMMGKSSLAAQYAKAAYSFERVLWADTAHPRILRGLYDAELLDGILSVLPEGGLVVFEDVPAFSEDMLVAFRAVCSELVRKGYRVLATCIPGRNPFQGSDLAHAAFGSCDLMYSDAELMELRALGHLPKERQGSVSRLGRIPGLMNCPSGAIEAFLLEQQSQTDDPLRQYLPYVAALLSCGTVEELSHIMGTPVSADDLMAGEARPCMVLTDFGRGFLCEGFPGADVLRVLKSQLSRLGDPSPGFDRDACFCRLSDALLARSAVDKATRTMVEACSPEARAEWVARNVPRMVEMLAPLNAILLSRSLDPRGGSTNAHLSLWDAVGRFLMGDARSAACDFKNIASDPEVALRTRLLAASFAGLTCDCHPSALAIQGEFGDSCLQARKRGSENGPLLQLWNAILEGDDGVSQLAEGPAGDETMGDWLLAAACCVRGVVLQGGTCRSSSDGKALDALLSAVVRAVDACAAAESFEMHSLILRRELECLGAGLHLSRETMSFLDQSSARLRVQRNAFTRLVGTPAWERASFGGRGSGVAARYKASRSSLMGVPILEVRVFGGFEASIGGHPVEPERLSRAKVKGLLALLALEAGKELSCERLAALMWPESTAERARRNFYSIFSILKHALTLEDGTCPYLVRSQGLCKLVAPYVRTDSGDLLDVCQQMRFGDITGENGPALLERMRSIYRGDLLPGERALLAVDSARRAWCGRVVDTCLAAAERLRDAGETSHALDCARFAFDCDVQREDACELLMTLQCALRKRTSAMETFFEYQRANRDLGLSPSKGLLALYDKIINDEIAFGDVLSAR